MPGENDECDTWASCFGDNFLNVGYQICKRVATFYYTTSKVDTNVQSQVVSTTNMLGLVPHTLLVHELL